MDQTFARHDYRSDGDFASSPYSTNYLCNNRDSGLPKFRLIPNVALRQGHNNLLGVGRRDNYTPYKALQYQIYSASLNKMDLRH